MNAKASDTKEKKTTEKQPPAAHSFKRKTRLTFPQLKVKTDVTVFFKFAGKIFQGKEIAAKEGEKKKQAPMLAKGIDLSTGEECEMIINAVLKSIVEETYPKEEYVGKGFEITKRAKEEGKAYNKFEVFEIEV